MDRTEALDLLRSGEAGVLAWNRRRSVGEKIPPLAESDLGGAQLRGADLRGTQFAGSRFRGADLRGADLREAQFRGTDLREAQLRGAGLIGIDLRGADLRGADLRGADLREAQFRGTDLREADLYAASCGGTAFAGVDLSETKGLQDIHHYGPSTIGTDTLIYSKGKIAEAFLYGCGLPDTWISRVPALVALLQPIQFYSCFISYSTQDQAFASRLHADLRREGVRCWFDQEDMKIGDIIRDSIYDKIQKHDKLMLVLSSHSIDSGWVEAEVEAALERERKLARPVLFPIKLDNAISETNTAWASHIRQSRHIGDFTDWANDASYQKAFHRLLRGLRVEDAGC